MQHVAIIGNGIAGITAARHIRKNSDFEITVISAESEHFWSRTALMYIYMGHMKYEHTKPYEDWFWEKNNINLVHDYVERVDTEKKSIVLKNGEPLNYDKLILATGAQPNKFGWPGQDLEGVSGMVSLQDLEYIEKYTKNIERAAIVGGGLIGVELAEMLHSRHIPTTFLVREKAFWNNVLPDEEAKMIGQHIKKHGIDLRLKTDLKEILSDENGRVRAIVTADGEEIPCQFLGLTPGVHPNIDLAKASDIEVDKGIIVNEYLQTNSPDVYAIGDCAQRKEPVPGRGPIEQVWYTGRMMGETVAQTITGNKTAYTPGHWFNSAKFFDIEYQTYGRVWGELKENEADFFWKHDTEDIAIHCVMDSRDKTFKGINTFGIRLRHEVFDQWLKTKVSLDHVIDNLEEANFDPEFFKKHESSIKQAYLQAFPEAKISIKKRIKVLGIF
ncbi:NAD(P)/FAD-dependent oxidoreductase [Fulvivirga sp. RKSG066]|uniref:NAD(P)/FAD-dependent oxidoreductase n=1 Tax=Fulvivirga aurantia TaxID=2529383 RepID=UPI0012BC9F3E|nr:FAD-dependent oxidoreductase [Fulvivirga aurantia]MTI21435.1 NAD(P)/FAD-dependent oxidoreductase [Fulvivirga aurantia]